MKNIIFLIILIFIVACSPQEVVEQPKPIQNEAREITKVISGASNKFEVKNMKLTSNDFNEGDMIDSKFTCQGQDINPQLTIEDVPSEAKSLALIVDDPDAPGGTWVHWLVKDIPINTSEIPQNSVPGTQVTNDFGKEAYGGPCPPSGVHRYFFKLYALDTETLEANNKEEFYQQAEQHAIAKAELMGKYTKG